MPGATISASPNAGWTLRGRGVDDRQRGGDRDGEERASAPGGCRPRVVFASTPYPNPSAARSLFSS